MNPHDWIAAGLDSYQTRLQPDGTLMPVPILQTQCLCGAPIERSAYIFNPTTLETRHIGACCYPQFSNAVPKRQCARCHAAHRCTTPLCKACRGPQLRNGKHSGAYISDIADVDPGYFDWMVHSYEDPRVQAWLEANASHVQMIQREYYADTVLTFGEHKGQTIRNVAALHPSYLRWVRTYVPPTSNECVRKIHRWMEFSNFK